MHDQFPHFQHLRVISCLVGSKRWRIRHVQAIAEICPSLEKIECYRLRRYFYINRGPSNGQVTVRASSRNNDDFDTEDEISDDDADDFDHDEDSGFGSTDSDAERDEDVSVEGDDYSF